MFRTFESEVGYRSSSLKTSAAEACESTLLISRSYQLHSVGAVLG